MSKLIKETTDNLIIHLDHKPGDRKFIEGTLENFKREIIKELGNTVLKGFINEFCIPEIKGIKIDPQSFLEPEELEKNQKMVNWLKDNLK